MRVVPLLAPAALDHDQVGRVGQLAGAEDGHPLRAEVPGGGQVPELPVIVGRADGVQAAVGVQGVDAAGAVHGGGGHPVGVVGAQQLPPAVEDL